MIFGSMVGWGVSAMPGNPFPPVAGPAGAVIAMAVGMAVTLIIARNPSRLMGRTAGIQSGQPAPAKGQRV